MLDETIHSASDLVLWTRANPDTRIIVADGPRVTISVRNRHILIKDGPPNARREREIARIPRKHHRIIILSRFGYITVEAGRWLSGVRIPWSIHDGSGVITATSGPDANDAAMIRAQVLAPTNPVGIGITRFLIDAKVKRQAHLLERRLGNTETANILRMIAGEVRRSLSIDEIRGLEGEAAATYWQVWNATVMVPFSLEDMRRVPSHWVRFKQRESYSTDYARNYDATDPVNAMLNFAYRIAETEAVHACHAIGMHPRLGIMHADKVGRDSLALDLIEPIRPIVDAIILDILSEPFSRKWVHELRDGIVRLDPPLTHSIVSRSLKLAQAIRPYVERVAGALAEHGGIGIRRFAGSIPTMPKKQRARKRRVLE